MSSVADQSIFKALAPSATYAGAVGGMIYGTGIIPIIGTLAGFVIGAAVGWVLGIIFLVAAALFVMKFPPYRVRRWFAIVGACLPLPLFIAPTTVASIHWSFAAIFYGIAANSTLLLFLSLLSSYAAGQVVVDLLDGNASPDYLERKYGRLPNKRQVTRRAMAVGGIWILCNLYFLFAVGV